MAQPLRAADARQRARLTLTLYGAYLMDWQSLTTLGLPILGIGALLCVYALYAFRKARKEAPPASNARFNGVGYVFFGLGVICWIGLSAWAILAFGFFNDKGRGQGIIVGMAVLVGLVFGALYVVLQACGVRFTKK